MIEQKCIDALEKGRSLVKNKQYNKALKLYYDTMLYVKADIEKVLTADVSRACWMIYSEMAELCSIKGQYTPNEIQGLYNDAFNLCQIAAKNNNIQAMRDLGFMYYSGGGTDMDYDQAIYWLERAAASPIPCDRTFCTLANIYKSQGQHQKAAEYFDKVQNFGIYIPPAPALPARFPQFMKTVKPQKESDFLLDNQENNFKNYGLSGIR